MLPTQSPQRFAQQLKGTPKIRAASASIASAAALLLITLGPGYVRSSTAVAVFAAACLTATCGLSLRRAISALLGRQRPRVADILSAAGALAILAVGILHAVAYVAALDRGLRIATLGMIGAIPFGVCCCLAGGFANLPRSWLPRVLIIVVGAPLVGWLATREDTLTTRALTFLSALAVAVASARSFSAMLRHPDSLRTHRLSAFLALLSTTGIGSIMLYALLVTATPARWWQDFAAPLVLALGYALSALCALVAGLVYRAAPAADSPQESV